MFVGYFLTPIHINLKSNKINTIDSISIYEDKKTYIEPVLKQLMQDTKYNNYQSIVERKCFVWIAILNHD